MINEAINEELLAEVRDATSDIAEESGKLHTRLENLPEPLTTLDIFLALQNYEHIKEKKGNSKAPFIKVQNLDIID